MSWLLPVVAGAVWMAIVLFAHALARASSRADRAFEERVDAAAPPTACSDVAQDSDADIDAFLEGLSLPELVGLARTWSRREARS